MLVSWGRLPAPALAAFAIPLPEADRRAGVHWISQVEYGPGTTELTSILDHPPNGPREFFSATVSVTLDNPTVEVRGAAENVRTYTGYGAGGASGSLVYYFAFENPYNYEPKFIIPIAFASKVRVWARTSRRTQTGRRPPLI